MQHFQTLSYESVVRTHTQLVFRTAFGFVHSKEDAEDITQEVFIKVYQSWNTFRGDASVSTWIYRITVNASLSFVEQKQRRSFIEWTEDHLKQLFKTQNNVPTPIELMEEKERELAIRNAIDSLPDRQRIAFILTYYEELSQREIAAIMELTEGAVEQLKQRAKKELQKKLRTSVGNI